MMFKDIPEGQYSAEITSFQTKALTSKDGFGDAIYLAEVGLAIDVAGETVAGFWQGFWLTKAGLPNQKTIKSLLACGFKGQGPNDLNNPKSMTLSATVLVTVEPFTNSAGKTYNQISWINDVNEGRGNTSAQAQMSYDKKIFAQAFANAKEASGERSSAKPVNHAPKSDLDYSEEIPF